MWILPVEFDFQLLIFHWYYWIYKLQKNFFKFFIKNLLSVHYQISGWYKIVHSFLFIKPLHLLNIPISWYINYNINNRHTKIMDNIYNKLNMFYKYRIWDITANKIICPLWLDCIKYEKVTSALTVWPFLLILIIKILLSLKCCCIDC